MKSHRFIYSIDFKTFKLHWNAFMIFFKFTSNSDNRIIKHFMNLLKIFKTPFTIDKLCFTQKIDMGSYEKFYREILIGYYNSFRNCNSALSLHNRLKHFKVHK